MTLASEWMINAAWEKRGKKESICRWCVVWKSVGPDEIAGAIAGYSGGGAFEVERFYGKLQKGNLTVLWIGHKDRVNGKEIDFDKLRKNTLAACEEGLDGIWGWNDYDEWQQSDKVLLLNEKKAELLAKKDMLYLAKDKAPFLRTVCEKAGLIAAPVE